MTNAIARPRVLAVTSEPPWPLDSGGHLRSFHLLRAISTVARLTVLVPMQPQQREQVGALQAQGLDIQGIAVGARTATGEGARLAGAVVRREPYVLYRRHAWRAVAAAFRHAQVEQAPHALYFDHLDSFVYAPAAQICRSAALVDLHNVYSLLARRAADEASNPVRRALGRWQADGLDRMERRVARNAAVLCAVSESEAAHFRSIGAQHVEVVPNGVDTGALSDLPLARDREPVVLFLGTLSWGPNCAAARFLAESVLPELRRERPDARLLLVGRNPAPDIDALARLPGVTVAANVPDVRPYWREASLLAVPLDAGGGTRLKILEAFAAGVPVVSTAIGMEGIAARPGIHFVEAGRAEFSQAILNLWRDQARGMALATAARSVSSEYDWSAIGGRMAGLAAELARHNQASAAR